MTRAKPSMAPLTVSVDTLSFSKEERQKIVNLIMERLPSYKVKKREIYNLLKVRYRSKGFGRDPVEKDVFKLGMALKRIITSLPKRLVLNGKDVYVGKIKENNKYGGEGKVDVWYYNDEHDSDVCRQFFQKLEAAMEGYIADMKLDDIRPTQKEVKEYFRRLEQDCERLENRLKKIDDGSRAFAASHGVDIYEHINYLGQLRQLHGYSETLEISKKSHARHSLCVAVGRALNTIGVAATTSRSGLMERLVCLLVLDSTGKEIGDIQDSIRAALTTEINNFT